MLEKGTILDAKGDYYGQQSKENLCQVLFQ